MSYLIKIDIGPVQDFIASARRSRDLWFGSWLLSELSKAAAESIGAKKLIFPTATDEELKPDSDFNATNKIFALVDDAKDAAKNAREAIQKRLRKIRDDAFNEIHRKSTNFNLQTANEQVEKMCEFYWVAIPFDENKNDYTTARKKIEYLGGGAKKHTRF